MADSRTPTSLLLKFTSMLMIIVFSYAIMLYVCIEFNQNSYLEANIDKIELLKKTKSPRIVFVGGSNLAFGLDSTRISLAFSLPVVNMGLHAGLGLKFMLDEVKPYLKFGDIVVIIPEYEQFTGDLFYGDKTLIEVAALTHNKLPILSMPIMQLANNVLKLNEYIFNYSPGRSSNLNTDPIYARNSFNSFGDVTAHLFLPNEKYSRDYKAISTIINKTAVQYLHNFIATNMARGITALIFYPCLERTYYYRNEVIIMEIEKALNANGIKALSTPQDFLYNDELFFNSNYHLNMQGRQLFTDKLSVMLANKLPTKAFMLFNPD